jgi:hypothetical protein
MIKQSEIEKAFGSEGSWDKEVTCDCGCDNVHVESVVVNQGSDEYVMDGCTIVDHNRMKTLPLSARTPNRTRGNDVLVVMYCEHGCRFAIKYFGHKGTLYVEKVNLSERVIDTEHPFS